MKTIIEDKGKFAIKEVDEAGNSLGTGAERFDTKEEAQAFIDSADGEATAPHGAEGDTPDAPSDAPENNPSPEDEGEKAPGDVTPEQTNDGQA